jgi:hypothetical protein
MHEKEREAANIYTSGRAGNRKQSGEAGYAESALPETATLNLNGRTPYPKESR